MQPPIEHIEVDSTGAALCPVEGCGIQVTILPAPGALFRRTRGCSHIVSVLAQGGRFVVGFVADSE